MKEIRLGISGDCARIDDEDYELISKHSWFKSSHQNTYAIAKIKGKWQYMHRIIMGLCDGGQIDHKDGDGLNNQRSNLRKCTPYENVLNRRGHGKIPYKGVYLHKEGIYRARINVMGKTIDLGCHKSPQEAALVYYEAAKKHHGEFARLNTI